MTVDVYVIFWVENDSPNVRGFDENSLSEALKFSEVLRLRKTNGESICHIVLSSENPNSVGKKGVGPAPSDYSWTKRREQTEIIDGKLVYK